MPLPPTTSIGSTSSHLSPSTHLSKTTIKNSIAKDDVINLSHTSDQEFLKRLKETDKAFTSRVTSPLKEYVKIDY